MSKLLHAFLLLFLCGSVGRAQIVLEIVKHPPLTPTGTGLYVAGEFNGWNPADPAFKLQRTAQGTYVVTLPDTLSRFEYKFTQGSWQLAEAYASGNPRPNRYYNRAAEVDPRHVRIAIEGWERKAGYRFIVTEVPTNTPHDAQLFITGNFNNWNPGNPAFQLRRQTDGNYGITIYTDAERLDYKITRGTWDAVEGNQNGKARPNRVVYRKDIVDDNPIEVHVLSWEDFSGTFQFFSLYDLLLLFAGFQGVLLLIAIPTIQNANRAANRWLLLLIGSTSVFLFFRVVGSYRDVAQTYTKLLLLPDFILFTYAPLFYFYIRRLLFRAGQPVRNWPYHFIPALVQLLLYMPYFLMDGKPFQLKIVNQDVYLQALFAGTGLVALLVNTGYWVLCRRTIRIYRERYQTSYSYEQNLQYLNTVLLIQGACLLLWLFTYLLLGVGKLFALEVVPIAVQSVDIIWLTFSTIIYFLGYFAIHQPEIFKMPDTQPATLFDPAPTDPRWQPEPAHEPALVAEPPEPESAPVPVVPAAVAAPTAADPVPTDEDYAQLKQQVLAYMKRYKPYTNPNLTIHELAAKVKLQPHVLSRVINDGFDKNFFDFINYYRVEELKARMNDPRYKQYTLLSLAFDVGFNSKTAFNRAFKKITQQTPSDYFSYSRE